MSVFGDIRSLLQEPPSAQGWDKLCALFERAPESVAREQLLPYVRAHLERHWPHELRSWNKSWTRRLIRGNTILVAGLASECDLRNRQLDKQSMELLARHDYIYGLRSLNLSENHHLGEALESLAQLPLLRDVHALNIGDCNTARHRDVSVFLDSPSLSKLKAIELGYYGGLNDHLRLLGTSQVRQTLEELSCSAYYNSEEFIGLLHLPMPALSALTLTLSQDTNPQLWLATEGSSWWQQLELLSLRGAVEIQKLWPYRPRHLKRLHIHWGLLSSEIEAELDALLSCEGLEQLESLTFPLRISATSQRLALLKRLNPTAARGLVQSWRSHSYYIDPTIIEYVETLPPTSGGVS